MALDDLYREVILDHYTRPRNKGTIDGADITVEGANPLCGDELSVYVKLTGGRISDVRFVGRGCSISQASASMMTDQIKGKTLREARALVGQFKAMMHGEDVPEEELGDLMALQGVRKFPVRIKCATLAWVALDQGVEEFESARGKVEAKATSEVE
ncbi:MAG: SUF system NifU family Fe-S cluster assembly protein [Bacillati bacterium ANGP1]|uniref:SUF system NifU family Fe-S cluster assembly protein n=1 Tax=Candidatus Segetimicrobium genomatis TaxID=2569760 RepID=A0A537J078_9BACT|nr:MAG: SUF system NifU family Fe-S cluster assembly protein [Terrabacteria group bacterium ANGP1]